MPTDRLSSPEAEGADEWVGIPAIHRTALRHNPVQPDAKGKSNPFVPYGYSAIDATPVMVVGDPVFAKLGHELYSLTGGT